jgi:hypothetical protein
VLGAVSGPSVDPPIWWIESIGYRKLFPWGVKESGREADHSPPSGSEVRNALRYNSNPPYVFMAWCLVKHRDNFSFV